MLKFAILLTIVICVKAWKKEMENPKMYQGDIQLSPDEEVRVKNKMSPFGSIKDRRWTNKIVPYMIDNTIDAGTRKAINDAIADYHTYTCLKFVPRKNEINYIRFTKGNGCTSPVGMSGGVNVVSLGENCGDKGTALHEIGHSIGLEHEQARPDRGKYVNINYKNIDPKYNVAFAFDISREVDSLGTEYDLRSMMHYSSEAFAKPGLQTITTVDPKNMKYIENFNQIIGFSIIDVQQIRKMYNCPAGPLPNNCVDKDKTEDCAYWQKSGLCNTNKSYMYFNCRKTCNVC
ncbi:hatching enzyme 1.2 [Hydra vulgaris]|uniref:hatching enzyme 1.2 n=1 Tax=Hydra vulgaris TaxID=6087 RepID=UPI001F5EBB6E|nr:hatching enzyme 1.2-like [Hydra vulgaris]